MAKGQAPWGAATPGRVSAQAKPVSDMMQGKAAKKKQIFPSPSPLQLQEIADLSKGRQEQSTGNNNRKGGAGGWLKAVQAINSNPMFATQQVPKYTPFHPMTSILNLASRQAKQSDSNLSAPLLTSRKEQDKLFIFFLFSFTVVIYILIYLAKLPPLLVHFWVIIGGCRCNSNNQKENKYWNELGGGF